MVSRESGARTLCLQCQLVAGCRLQFRWCFWGLSANLHREPLKMERTIDGGRQAIETCNLRPESFRASYVVAPWWHGFRFKHRFWRSKFQWNRVSIRAPTYCTCWWHGAANPFAIPFFFSDFSCFTTLAVCQEPSLNLASEDYNESIGWALRRNAEWNKCCHFWHSCGQS